LDPFDERLFEEGVPSERTPILRALEQSRIAALTRYSWDPPVDCAAAYGIDNSQVFSLTQGPVLIRLESGVQIGVGGQESQISLTLWLEADDQGRRGLYQTADQPDLHAVDACDPVFSNQDMCSFIGQRIVRVGILQREPKYLMWKNCPRESGVVLAKESGQQLVLAHMLHAGHATLTVITPDLIDPDIVNQLKEIPWK
jgi:hypothetical protein